MADVKKLVIELAMDSTLFKKGAKEGEDAVNKFGKATTVAMATAGAAVITFAVKSANSYLEYGKSIMALSRLTGENIETSSRMAVASQLSGVSTDKFATSMKFLEKNMAANNPQFASLGVSVQTAGGHMRSTRDVLLDTADAVSHLRTGSERTAAAVALFGRGGQEMVKFLEKGRAGIIELESQAEKYGLVLTQDDLPGLKANIEAHRKLDLEMQGLQNRVGKEVLPVMTALVSALASVPGPIMQWGAPIALATAGILGLVVGTAKVVASVRSLQEHLPQVNRIFGNARDMASGAADKVGGMGQAAAGAAGLIGAGIAIYTIWNNAMNQAKEAADALAKQVTATNNSDTYTGMVDHINKIQGGISDLDNEIANSHAPWDADYRAQMEIYRNQLQKSQDELKNQAGMIDDLSVVTGDSKEKLKSWLNEEAKAGRTYDSSEKALAAYRGEIDVTGDSAEDTERKIASLRDATKQQNAEEDAATQPVLNFIDARKKHDDAVRGVTSAERGLEDAHRGVAEAEANVVRADQRRKDAADTLTEAVRTQAEAQARLNDELRGPTEDETLNLEQAQLTLEEAKRRAAGQTGTDPALERRRNQLDLRRAEIGVHEAEGAHAKNVAAAQKDLGAANKGVQDAQNGVTDAAKGQEDAYRGLRDAGDKVTEAERNVADAHLAVFVSAIGVDKATRDLETAYAVHDVSADKTRETLDRLAQQGAITKDEMMGVGWAFVFAKAGADLWDPDQKRKTAPAMPDRSEAESDTAARDQAEFLAHRASGGMMTEGWTLVGEAGPELAYKSGNSVRIMSNPVTRGTLTPHPPGITASSAHGGGGGYVHNGDINIGTATERTPGDIVYQQRLLALSLAAT